MRIPTIQGVIDRRILVNYAIDPGVLARELPPPFQPKLHNGLGVGGICLIRLKELRPRLVPRFLGLTSENAAHRISAQWPDAGGAMCEGVYISRRDSSSRLNTLLGGRLFPGLHHHARFQVRETDREFSIVVDSDDGDAHIEVEAKLASRLPPSSLFGSIADASRFFEEGSVGYSDTHRRGQYDGLELRTSSWKVEPLEVTRVASSYFDDRSRFPEGSIRFDCALLMRGVSHQWRGMEPLCEPICRSIAAAAS
ncbi:MAG: DUF2071 domain-containing protein [Pirellulales bacterium]|nr:DUF2071 domain-containing protein [Pirellulales bacterium]